MQRLMATLAKSEALEEHTYNRIDYITEKREKIDRSSKYDGIKQADIQKCTQTAHEQFRDLQWH